MKNPYQTHLKKMKKNNVKFNVKKDKAQDESKSIKKTKKGRIPLQSIVGTIFLIVGSWYGYEYSDELERVINKVEISFFGQAIAQNESSNEEKSATSNIKNTERFLRKGQVRKTDSISSSSLTPEELALFKSLEERKVQLDNREQELKKLEEELHKQKEELDARLTQLDQLRGQIGNKLEERVQQDNEQVDKLVAFYMNMKPQRAAQILETVNEDLAVEVLKKMKKKEAAEIMNAIKPEKAQKLSERFAGYRK